MNSKNEISADTRKMVLSDHPFLDTSWPIQWSRLQPCYVVEDIRLALQEASSKLEALEQVAFDDLSWDHTLEPLLHFDDVLKQAWAKVHHLNSVCDSEDLRKAYLEVLPEVTQFYTSIPFRTRLWKLIQAYAATEEAQQLPEVRKRYLQRTMEGFVDSGADLEPEKKARILEIEQRLSFLANQFGKNVLDAKNAWTYDATQEELQGLPESVLRTLQRIGSKNERYRLTLQAPCFGPCMQYLENRALRQKLWKAYMTVGREAPYDNMPLIREILSLSEEHAHILGEPTHADCVLRRRMAKSGQQALQFIEDLHRRIEKFFHRDVQKLQDFYHEQTDDPDGMRSWDAAYWSEKLCQQLYHFDEEALRPYFAIEAVIQGLFSVAEKLYGIRIRECPTETTCPPEAAVRAIPVWHESVKFYEVFEASGNYIGAFYADWFPRPSKRGGAWMENLITGHRNANGMYQYPIGIICGNLTPPSAEHPSLLTHQEVLTIFHEFGHLLHGLFGKVDIEGINATHVVWDFVELPSQLMENFGWDRKSLDLFARHYETGKRIPKKLFQAMRSARHHLSGMSMMKQLSLSKLDLELYHHYEQYRDVHWEENLQKTLVPYRPPWNVDTPSILAQFDHIFDGGYDAGYYSYIWAQVLEADAFSAFEKRGILDPETGNRFRHCILSQGDLCDAGQLYRDFMGRNPDPEALLKREHLWEVPLER
ncbi:MAG: M3 family metallopeptidase [Puniceicoccales bacterium]|nr:M3 family metallopeptidase [Puniceicoccales bacterium]